MTAAPSMAEVLAEHREDPTYPDTCICETEVPDYLDGHYAEHLADALAAAGFGHVASVAAHAETCERVAMEQAERAEAAEARVAAAAALHRPIRVYEECDHDADHGCEPIEVYDYTGCSESAIGWACATCCYDDEYPIECCPHGADHRGVTEADSCPTRAALDGEGGR